MRLAILRRAPRASFSMDIYADGLVGALKALHPDWQIIEISPGSQQVHGVQNSWGKGLQKYYERYWRYPQSLKSLDVDLAHIIDHSDGDLVYGLKQQGIPTVVTCHDIINWIRPDWFRGKAKLPWLSMAIWKHAVRGIAEADHVISVSRYTANDLVQYLSVSPQAISVAPNGISPDLTVLPPEQRNQLRQQFGLADHTCCLLNVGSNNPRKNIEGILRSLVFLKGQDIPVHFWKVGHDFSPEQRQYIQTHDLKSCVSYLGKPDESTLMQLYNAADILLAPSIYEGFGLTVLEAMACGTPVITANVSSLPEVVGDAALLVDPLDIEAIGLSVSRIYRDPDLRQRLIERGLARSREFTWEKTAEKVTDVYLQVLKKVNKKEFSFELLTKK